MIVMLSVPALAEDEPTTAAERRAKKIEYIHLKPGFIANYGGAGRLRYVKVDISLRCIGPSGTSLIRHHMPAIRHAIVMLISGESEESMFTSVGKEELRLEALKQVREVLMKEEGKQNVEDLLFNSFIVQQ